MRISRSFAAFGAFLLAHAIPLAAGAQATPLAPLAAADSAVIARLLVAEEGRNAASPALEAGARHRDPRVRRIAQRATARITDSVFAGRDSLAQPGTPALPHWPEPEWKARYRALASPDGGCEPLTAALADSVMAVRLRAMDLAGTRAECRAHLPMQTALLEAVDGPSAARGIIALARLAPDAARARIADLAGHPMPIVRRAAARAAALVRDSVTLRALGHDVDGNVLEAVLQGLSRVTGHADDSLALRLLDAAAPQVALAAAEALKGSAHPDLEPRAAAALAEFVRRASDSERDVRLALLALLGRPSVDPVAGRAPPPLPPDAVALALGAPRYLEVTVARGAHADRFTVELRGDVAPIMAARILEHARRGGYDGQRWHRVEWDFVIQGGSPHDNEYSGAARYLVDELSAIPHPRGSVGMSTRGHDTGDAQWFVNLRDNPRLMRDYTVFGMVVAGMDVVDAVLEGDVITSIREVNAPARRGPP